MDILNWVVTVVALLLSLWTLVALMKLFKAIENLPTRRFSSRTRSQESWLD